MEINTFGVEEWLNLWENDAIYNIAGSTIASMTLEEIVSFGHLSKESFVKEMLEKKMDYGWIEGSPEFKQEVCQLYRNVKPNQVLQTNGATGANLLALYALVEPQDHVISLYPTYQQLYDIPKSFGAKVELWHNKEETGWLPSLNQLRKLVRPTTKIICINNANNPTGAIMDEAFLTELVDIARQVGAYVLSDEVYMSFEHNLQVPAIVDLYEKGITTNSLSKTYSVPGIRVGWIVSNEEVTEVFRKYRDYTMICAGVIDDFIGTYVLKNKETILRRNREIVYRNLEIVQKWIENEPLVSVVYPRYVSTAFIKVDVSEDIETFCIRLLKQKGVLLVPGNRFSMPGYARLGYCVDTETLTKGLAALSEFLREYTE